ARFAQPAQGEVVTAAVAVCCVKNSLAGQGRLNVFQALSKTHLFTTTLVCAGLLGFVPACGDSGGSEETTDTDDSSGSGSGESGDTTTAGTDSSDASTDTSATDDSTSGGFVPTDTGDSSGETTSTGPQ